MYMFFSTTEWPSQINFAIKPCLASFNSFVDAIENAYSSHPQEQLSIRLGMLSREQIVASRAQVLALHMFQLDDL